MGFWDEHKGSKWSPEQKGEQLVGVIKRLRNETNRKNEHVPVVTVERHPDGRVMDVWCGVDLRTQLAELEPAPGWKVRLTYDGERNTGQPQPMKLFTVEVWSPKDTRPPAPDEEIDRPVRTADGSQGHTGADVENEAASTPEIGADSGVLAANGGAEFDEEEPF